MQHDQHHHKRSFLINYVSNKIGKGQENGFHNGNATMTANGNAYSTNTNGNSDLSSKLEKSHRFNKLFVNDDDSESDALISGDERCFDVEFTDDDCVALEPRGPHMNFWS